MRDGLLATIVPAVLLLAGCSGNGIGLDENGRPLEQPGAPLTPEFASIQDHVFTPICTACHEGAAAPLGMRLDEGAAYAALVNAPSVEVPGLRRVDPGNPAGSYMLQKIQGTAAVGGRMPLDGPPLPQATIDTIRQWIQDGAQPPVAMARLAGTPTRLSAIFPVNAATLDAAPGSIVIAADAELDTSTVNGASVVLTRSGGDGSFAEGNEVAIAGLQFEIRSFTPMVFAIMSRAAPWVADRYRLVVSGTGQSPVLDRGALLIDGDADGRPGGDFVLDFDLQVQP